MCAQSLRRLHFLTSEPISVLITVLIMGWGTTDSFPESGFAGSWLYEALLLVAAYTFAAGRCTLWAPLRRLLCWVLERAGVFAGCHALAPQPRSSRPVVALLLEDVPAAVTGRALLEVT